MGKKELFKVVLVHTARTWERIRVEKPNQEMVLDNIESVDEIIEIAEEIMKDKKLKKFLKISEYDFFLSHTNMLSDSYIEMLAEQIIIKRFGE